MLYLLPVFYDLGCLSVAEMTPAAGSGPPSGSEFGPMVLGMVLVSPPLVEESPQMRPRHMRDAFETSGGPVARSTPREAP